MSETETGSRELTPVDDVRKVRESIDAEFGGDINKIADHAHKVAEKYYKALGLKVVSPPQQQRDGTRG